VADLSDSGTTPPVQPAKQTAAYRAALAAVILLSLLIAIALGTLVIGFAMHAGGRPHDSGATGAVQLVLAPDMKIVSADFSGDRLVLRLHGPAGDQIDIIDTGTGRLVARVRSAAPPPRK
jgi:hypothetical protein